ncbi:MAG: Rab family GTPase [Candidatus Odinarchaeota archaeon]
MEVHQVIQSDKFKIAILGEGGSGKTTLCKTYDLQKTFLDTQQTIAVDFHVLRRTVQGREYTLQIWDLAGQVQFKNMNIYDKYCKGVRGALACFDLTDIETLYAIPEWLAYMAEGIPVMLVGTKADLAETDDFIREEVQKLIKEHGIIDYIETSALDVKTVEKAFDRLLERIPDSKTETSEPKQCEENNPAA